MLAKVTAHDQRFWLNYTAANLLNTILCTLSAYRIYVPPVPDRYMLMVQQ
ncbi:hypothetical protein [Thaumasiovibrio sp. DFM-14]